MEIPDAVFLVRFKGILIDYLKDKCAAELAPLISAGTRDDLLGRTFT